MAKKSYAILASHQFFTTNPKLLDQNVTMHVTVTVISDTEDHARSAAYHVVQQQGLRALLPDGSALVFVQD